MKPKHNNYTILFVCSGNSCRSPMAAALLEKKLRPRYGNQLKIHSAGTLGIHDHPATLPAIMVSSEKGVDISDHLSKGLKKRYVAEADIIFAMAAHHKEFIDSHYPAYKENVFLLKCFAASSDKSRQNSIEDPIGQSIEFYQQIISEIDQELDRILPQLEQLIDLKLKNGLRN